MAQSKVFVVLACSLLVFVAIVKAEEYELPEPTEEDLKEFKNEIDTEIAEGNITCQNYATACTKGEDDNEPNPFCTVVLNTYLCEGPQNLDTVKRIIEKINKLTLEPPSDIPSESEDDE